ncbi:hypothetical protein [Staphylococcus cohnii]|uniref:hypothetical protein n=1 Tax=Staphylococcus cohnii TaxID=29382 RepID=UPI0011062B72|nr:hypothetical protein [Staphylococcus cohnii]TLW35972.1 hypothetical protein FFX88_08725 [Staphylococcus cohnii]
MSEKLLKLNLEYLANVNIEKSPEKEQAQLDRENQIKFFIANTLAGLDYGLTNDDFVFSYTLSDDIDKETRQPDVYYIAVLTQKDILYKFLVSTDSVHVTCLDVVKTSVISIAPKFASYNFKEPISIKRFKDFDHLSIILDKVPEIITLYGHTYEGNKPLKDVARDLKNRLK